jgi:hypothetical protein
VKRSKKGAKDSAGVSESRQVTETVPLSLTVALNLLERGELASINALAMRSGRRALTASASGWGSGVVRAAKKRREAWDNEGGVKGAEADPEGRAAAATALAEGPFLFFLGLVPPPAAAWA